MLFSAPSVRFHYDEFWGMMCGCTKAIPQSSLGILDHCQFLREQGIFFYKFLGFFVCTTHGILVHPLHIKVHLNNVHDLKSMVGKPVLLKLGWINLLGHIERTFGVITKPHGSASRQDLLLDPEWNAIEVAVPGLPLIDGFQCSLCYQCFGAKKSLVNHYSAKHRSIKHSSEHLRVNVQRLFSPSMYKQPLFPKDAIHCFFQVIEVPKTTLQLQMSGVKTLSSLKTIKPTISTFPSYVSTLGWLEWLQGTQSSPLILKQLITPPKKQRKSSKTEVKNQIEQGLWETSELLKGYLEGADNTLSSRILCVRDAIRGQ